MKIDWSKIDHKYKWVTGDITGIWAWEDEPDWKKKDGFYSSDSGQFFCLSCIPSEDIYKVKRPTEGDTNED